MRKALWEQPAPVPVQKEDEPQPAEAVAERTRELLATRGWCLWKCNIFGGEVIAVVLDENVDGVPEGYPIYTIAELGAMNGVSYTRHPEKRFICESTLRLVHEAKKLTGAKVTAVAGINNGGT